MRHLYRISAVCVASMMLACVFAVFGETAQSERQSLTISKTKTPIIVDGNLDDWPKDAVVVKLALDPECERQSGTCKLTWDDKNLYVAFEVASGKGMLNRGDDASVAFKTGETVEVFLSVNPAPLADRVPRGPSMDTAKEGDYRILMTLLRNTKPVVFGYDFVNAKERRYPLVLQMAGPIGSADVVGPVPGAELAVKNCTVGSIPGYTAEASIPWEYFRGYKPKSGDRLLFDLAINFANASGTANMGKCYWSSYGHMVTDVGVEAQVFPENWGWLELK